MPRPQPAALLQDGLAAHRGGDLAKAEHLYRAALAADPQLDDAAHYLGVVAQQKGDLAGSVRLIRAALARKPTATAWSNLANALWLQGQLAEAEHACRQALALDPTCGPALQNLGNVQKAAKRYDEAEATYARALALSPDNPDLLSNLGVVLGALDRPDEARAAFDQALAARPGFPAALFNLANLEAAFSDLDTALAAYDRLLAAAPAHADGHAARGAVLRRLGRGLEAEAAYAAAVAARPQDEKLHGMLGELRLELNLLEEAEAGVRAAMQRFPKSSDLNRILARARRMQDDGAGALAAIEAALALGASGGEMQLELGAAKRAAGDHDGAIAAYVQAVRLKPDLSVAYANLGGLLHEEGRSDEATRPLLDGLKVDPNLSELHVNLGGVRLSQSRFTDAMASFRAALAIKPDSPEAVFGVAVASMHMGELDAAIAGYEAALALKELPEARWMLGLALLKRGNYLRGFREHESRLLIRAKKKIARDFSQPRWSGQPLAGKTLLVHSEQGLGDSLQCLRFAPQVAALGARVLLQVQEALLPLLAGLDGPFEAFGPHDAPPAFDYHCPMFSLPTGLATTLETLPAAGGYLAADPALTATWADRLKDIPGLKVGVVWQGNPRADVERGRSFPLRALAPLAAAPGVSLVSLQKDHGLDQLDALPAGMTVQGLGFDYEVGSFADTAAILANLDLLVTCDTSVGHLSGALGRPTWIAVNAVGDWRWLTDRADSPWYDSVRVFRQAERGDWDSVAQAMAAALGALSEP